MTIRGADWAEYSAELFERDVVKIAERLRWLADEVEREGKARPNPTRDDPTPDFSRAAERVVHAIMWGMANLSLDSIVNAADEAGRAARAAT